MRGRLRSATVASLTLGSAVLAISSATAGPIGGASYKGSGRGDVDKTEFTVSHDGKVIGSMTVGFDSRCRQGGNDYTNKNTSVVFYSTRIRPSGKFKAKDKRNYPGGGDVSVAKGRFSADGTSVAGRFSFHGTFSGGGVERVECSASGRFKAETKEKPPSGSGVGGGDDVPLGLWEGKTAEDLPVQFSTERGGIVEFEFIVNVQCDRGFGSQPTFTQEHYAVIERVEVKGSSFEGTHGPERASGQFSGKTASGVVSVASHFDDFDQATCSTPAEVPFSARLRD